MTKVHHVKSARKPIPSIGVEVGQPYYWWAFNFGTKQVSKTYPTRSQLTSSSFLSSVYDLEDSLPTINATDVDEFESAKEDLLSSIEDLKQECEDSLSNMPEQLQESSIHNERIEALENWISEVESISCDIDEDSIREQVISEFYPDKVDLDSTDEEDITQKVSEKITDIVMDSIEELRGTSSGL